MLEIEKETVGAVPVLRLKGRFDSLGATSFDREAASLPEEAATLVLDLSQVSYLSSMGVRSLLKLEKTLHPRGGSILLAGITPFLERVLELSGLLRHFSSAPSVNEAVQLATKGSPTRGPIVERTAGGRRYRVRALGGAESFLDGWGMVSHDPGKGIRAGDLTAVSLQDLGPSFGIGGFGPDREEASKALGEFVGAGRLAGVVPADGHGVPDFMLTEDPSGSHVFIASAAGFSGGPAFCLESEEDQPVTLAELVDDVFTLMGRDRSNLLGLVVSAQAVKIATSRPEQPGEGRGKGERSLVLIGIGEAESREDAPDGGLLPWFLEMGGFRSIMGNTFHGHALLFSGCAEGPSFPSPEEALGQMTGLEDLSGVAHLEAETEILRPRVWVYPLIRVRPGREKLLLVEVKEDFPDPWQQITRRLFSDAGRVVLEPLRGGYMGKTFRAIPYGKDGRRMLPGVLKLGPDGVIQREVKAFHEYVEKYVLNNSTSIMGHARSGEWGGIRYTFVGIGGPESKLTWFAEHYRRRPVEEVLVVFNRIVAGILKPWYGQPRWEEIRPYEEHNPLRLFPRILEDAEKTLEFPVEKERFFCAPLNLELPNPFHFLKHEYPKRMGDARLWYRCVVHGDLNMQNILLDEAENIYVIDFSETGMRNAVSDFARLEAIVKIETTRLEGEEDLKTLLGFETGLSTQCRLAENPPYRYGGTDPMAEKAYRAVCLLRGYADRVTLFENDMIPYLLALLQWTYPVVSYGSASPWQKRFAAYSAGLIVRQILDLEGRSGS